jgi:hypothetical protein
MKDAVIYKNYFYLWHKTSLKAGILSLLAQKEPKLGQTPDLFLVLFESKISGMVTAKSLAQNELF